MRHTLKVNTMNLKALKAVLLGTSALVCFALSAPVMARDIVITSGTTTNNSGGSLNGNDTANVTGTLDTGTTDSEHGILASDDDNKITVSNEGHIITGGDDASGIYHTGDSNTNTVSGSITTTGDDSYGIHNKGDTNTTTVSGSIATGNVSSSSGSKSHGIFNEGNDNTTTLSGDITTLNNKARGIRNDGNNNTTTVSGSIETTGTTADAIRNAGNEDTTTITDSLKPDAGQALAS